MPEGPTIVILSEQAARFAGQTMLRAEGNSKLDKGRLVGERVIALRRFGKEFLIELQNFSIRIHLLMFGSYRIDERKETPPRLSLAFANGEPNFHACSVRYLESELDDLYDWRLDVMSEHWDPARARRALRAMPAVLACDALLDQDLFAGVGNIIRNEVLFRIRVHPLSTVGALPARMLHELVDQARQYSFEFLDWKKAFVLRKHWLAHNRSICPRDQIPFQRAYLGRTHRRSFFCERCQKKYPRA